jgi:hypothetical protein
MIDIQVEDVVFQSLEGLQTVAAVETLLTNLAEAARAKWMAVARTSLGPQTREAYLNGIQEIEVEPGLRIITLTGWLPNAIENGIEGFDMRKTLLLNPRSRLRRPMKGGGWYGNVPFRHGTPGSRGLSGTPMGSAYAPPGHLSRRVGSGMYENEAKKLGKDIHKAAKALGETVRVTPEGRRRTSLVAPSRKTIWGERLKPWTAGAGKLRTHHKTDIYAGMVRVRHTYEKATQAKYMTWRRISTRVSTGWRHPGITARNLVDEVESYIRKLAPKLVAAAVREAMGG